MAKCEIKYKLEFLWQDISFYLLTPIEALNLYAINNNISCYQPTNPNTSLLVYYNLVREVYARLNKVYRGLKIVALESNVEVTTYSQRAINVKLNKATELELLLVAREENIEDLVSRYYSSQLNLPKISPITGIIPFTYDGNDFTLEFDKILYKEDNQPQFIKLVLLIANQEVSIFVAKSLFVYLYQLYYPKALPFKFDNYFLELITNLINLILCRVKAHKILVSHFSICKLPAQDYIELSFKHLDFTSPILLPSSDSPLLTILQELAAPAANSANGVNDGFADTLISFPVVSHYCYVTEEQLKQLKVGDVLLGLNKVNEEQALVIELGNMSLVTDEEDGKLLIQGRYNTGY